MEVNDQSKLYPFESMGVENFWELQMPKAANPNLDFSTIADVWLIVEYTTLQSPTYRELMIQQLDRTFSPDRAYSFRYEFADQWYDLNHPELSNTPMAVTFETRQADFPANLEDVKIKHLILYFSRSDSYTDDIESVKLAFDGKDGTANTVGGLISTRQAHGVSWAALTASDTVEGEWTLTLPCDNANLKQAFKDEQIEDMLFVITYEGMTPDWPV